MKRTETIAPESTLPAEFGSPLQQISRNAYRILGLPGDAAWHDIAERAATLLGAAKAGLPECSPWNLTWYDSVPRDEASVSDALDKLSDPRQRLQERLFWIGQSEAFVKDIPAQGVHASVTALAGSFSPQHRHDAAILASLFCFSTDPDVEDPERWKTALRIFIEALAEDDFWSAFLAVEESGGFEPAASFEDVDRLRTHSLQLVAQPLLALVKEAAAQGEFSLCRRLLRIIRTAGFPSYLVFAIEEDLFGPYEKALHRISNDIGTRCWRKVLQGEKSPETNASICAFAVDRWKCEFVPKYKEFAAMTGLKSSSGLRASQNHAQFLASLGNALTWANQWAEAELIFSEALTHLAHDNPARERITTSLRTAAIFAAQQLETSARETPQPAADENGRSSANAISRFVELCESIRLKPQRKHFDLQAAHVAYQQQAAPWLAIIVDTYRDNAPILAPVRNAAARCLSSLAYGFIYAKDLDAAQSVAIEAARLVSGEDRLAREIERYLELIASERLRAARRIKRVKLSPRKKKKPEPGSTSLPQLWLRASPASARSWIAPAAGLLLFALIVVGVSFVLSVGDTPSTKAASPADAPPASVSLPNGANITKPAGLPGFGLLSINNYCGDDAVVKLKAATKARTTIRFVYVRALSDVTVSRIPPGNYFVQFSTGRDWDRGKRMFREDQTFAQFKRPLPFSEHRKDKGVTNHSEHTIALHEVLTGTVQKKSITAAEFNR